MSAKFDGAVQPGDEVVISCEGVWLRGQVLRPFDGGPGRSSALTVRVAEVLAGKFPAVNSLEELTVNANSWDVYLADEAPEAPKRFGGYDDLIEALEIFSHYEGSNPHAEHDEFWAGPSVEKISLEHRSRLKELNWHNYDGDIYSTFV